MRYLLLVALNLPLVLLALINIVTQYKLGKVSRGQLTRQLFVWLSFLIILVTSFPIYNYLRGYQFDDSRNLSIFDILQTTAIAWLFYIINNQRRKLEQTEQRLRHLHERLSIQLSSIETQKQHDQTKQSSN